jgi:hypothetical protein
MNHPYSWLPQSLYSKLFKRILPFSLLVTVAMVTLHDSLKSATAPLGIVSLQMARTPQEVQTLLAHWTGNHQVVLQFGLGLDYLYMVAYSLAISLACVLGGEKHSQLKTWAAWASWGAIVAGLLDAVENAACIIAITSAPTPLTTQLTYTCATIKFTLVALGLLFALVTWLSPVKKELSQ